MADLEKRSYAEKLEISFNPNETMFLNFWDWAHGNDVTAEIKNNQILLNQFDENGEELAPKEISIFDFLKLVKTSILQREL